MGFTEEQILSMIVRCPKLFTSNIVEIDQVLGFLQKFQVSTKKLNLLPDEVRSLVIRYFTNKMIYIFLFKMLFNL